MKLEKCILHKVRSLHYMVDLRKKLVVTAVFYGNEKNSVERWRNCGCTKTIELDNKIMQETPLAAFKKLMDEIIPGVICQIG